MALAPSAVRAAEPPLVLEEIPPSLRLTITILEGDGTPAAARVSVSAGATGEPFWPDDPSVPIYEAYTGHKYFYADSEIDVLVSPGWVRVLASRGPEYSVADLSVFVTHNMKITAPFTRLFDPAAIDLYGGDVHVHIAHGGEGAVYTITNEDLALVARAEGLHVTCALTNGPYFNGGLDPAGDADHLIHFGVEYRSALYGHMSVLGLGSLLSQYACCLPGELPAPLNLDIQEEAHAKGATVTYAHPVTMNPSLMNNTSGDWPYSGFPREIPVDLLVGDVDAYDIFSYSNYDQGASRELWFDLLNLGRRLPLSVGTDSAINRFFDPPPGGYRLYVKTPGGLDFAAWRAGLEAGHSFATNGPLIVACTVDGAGPGETLALSSEGTAPLSGEITIWSRTSADRLDIYRNGILILSETLAQPYGHSLTHNFQLPRPTESGWLVARVSGPLGSEVDIGTELEAVTSPIRVVVDGAAMTPPQSAVWQFTNWIEDLETIVLEREGWENPGQIAAAWNDIDRARRILTDDGHHGWVPPPRDHFEQVNALSVSLAAHPQGRTFRAEGTGTGVLEVFDVQGRRVYVSDSRPLPSAFAWRPNEEGLGLASGLYFGRVRSGEAVSRTYRLQIVR